jgi:hypothetical protein
MFVFSQQMNANSGTRALPLVHAHIMMCEDNLEPEDGPYQSETCRPVHNAKTY